MRNNPTRNRGRLAAAAVMLMLALNQARAADSPRYLSPAAMVSTRNGEILYIACATADRVLRFECGARQVTASFPLPGPPTGLALAGDDSRLYATCGSPEGKVCVIDPANGKLMSTWSAGHSTRAPVLAPDGKTLFVCNRFNDDVQFLDAQTGSTLARVQVEREPMDAATTPDGKFLLVANALHAGAADRGQPAAAISVIDVASRSLLKHLRLPSGSGSVADVRISPDGRYAVATHVLSRFHLPATQVDRGWMNSNAATFIDLSTMEILNTVLLDSVDHGAANPRAAAWSADSAKLVIAHAGTHEISIIDVALLIERLRRMPRQPSGQQYGSATAQSALDVPSDLAFLVDFRRFVKLPPGNFGPRSVLVLGNKCWVANYFSDTLSALSLEPGATWDSIPLDSKVTMDSVRKGEFWFHDASICFQGWQSCSSCHPGEARADALNWDLLNDGIGNPKNTKSLLFSHRTPPAMSTGVRGTAEDAVRAGIKHILFTVQPEAVALAIDEYLKSLRPLPSPLLVKGKLSDQARRGQKLFRSSKVGCAGCHSGDYFTDLQSYEVGTGGAYDKPGQQFDTPTLIETWRTAPYLHDGSAATMRDVLTTRNPKDEHGRTSHLKPQEIDDLAAYLMSL